VKDGDRLLQLLAELVEALAGKDWAEGDDEFERLCDEAAMDFEEVMRPPSRTTPRSDEDLRRKELGDLGELLALLHALAHLGYNPALVLPKNALKIFERKSESGIDVLCFEMTLEADETGPLPEDRALIIESKVGPDSPYRSLAREAADYFDSVSAHQKAAGASARAIEP
jgi:hypothetical protein